MAEINTIIFDLDGTLIDSKEDIIASVNYALGKLHYAPKSRQEIISYIGTGSKDLIRKSLDTKEDDQQSERAHTVFVEYFRKHSYDKTVLFPHTKEVLEYLQNKKLFILTNRQKKLAKETLKHFDIYKYFDDIKGGDSNKCQKPSGCPVDEILNLHRLPKEKSMIVGDMDIDIKTGKDAGIYTCGVTYGIGDTKDLKKSGPDYLINDLLELKKILKMR